MDKWAEARYVHESFMADANAAKGLRDDMDQTAASQVQNARFVKEIRMRITRDFVDEFGDLWPKGLVGVYRYYEAAPLTTADRIALTAPALNNF